MQYFKQLDILKFFCSIGIVCLHTHVLLQVKKRRGPRKFLTDFRGHFTIGMIQPCLEASDFAAIISYVIEHQLMGGRVNFVSAGTGLRCIGRDGLDGL